ncbi:MAG: hypothetical protein ACI86M_001056 [Saprospiraceae bacterium]|jgi:hypothetical protein
MKKYILILFFGLGVCFSSSAQYYYGVKGGLGLNMQKWNTFERDILFTPLIDIFTETHDDPINKVYASLGLHTRGSAVRGFGFQSFNSYKFNNLSLEVGFKQMLSVDKKYNPYYMLAGRLEYTVSTNLGGRSQFSVFNLVDDNFVNKLNYGLTIGGGFEFNWSDTKVIFIEASINPDASKQYDQPSTAVINNPNPSQFNPSQTITILPQEVRNVSLELKIGIKFLQGYWEEDEEY